jgi:anti-sigma factor RsiW
MNCETVRNIEDLYIEGRLTVSRKEQVEAHLKDCAACSEKAKRANPLSGLHGVKAPQALKERMKKLLANLETAAPVNKSKTFSVDSEFWPVAASIAISLILALLLAWAGPGVTSQGYEKAAIPSEVTP